MGDRITELALRTFGPRTEVLHEPFWEMYIISSPNGNVSFSYRAPLKLTFEMNLWVPEKGHLSPAFPEFYAEICKEAAYVFMDTPHFLDGRLRSALFHQGTIDDMTKSYIDTLAQNMEIAQMLLKPYPIAADIVLERAKDVQAIRAMTR